VEIKAATKELLIKQVFEYRMRNNIAPGDVEKDIDLAYCSKWPDACWKEPHEQGRAPKTMSYAESMLGRVSRWATSILAKMPSGGVTLVGQSEATSRAAICTNCAKNMPWRGGCSGCSKSAVTVLAQIRRMNRTPNDGQLMGCQVGGWDNATAAWMTADNVRLTEEQRQAAPGNCWARDLQ
jgi:hypothetical protein